MVGLVSCLCRSSRKSLTLKAFDPALGQGLRMVRAADEGLEDVEPCVGAESRLRAAVQIGPGRPDVLAEKSSLDSSMVDVSRTPGPVVGPGFSFAHSGSVKSSLLVRGIGRPEVHFLFLEALTTRRHSILQ